MTRLTAPISAESVEQVCRQASRAVAAGAQTLELRLDYLDPLTVQTAAEAIEAVRQIDPDCELIFTCRDSAEGGAGDWPVELRLTVLAEGARLGTDFIDFEFENYRRDPDSVLRILEKCPETRLILSAHNFEGPFEDLSRLADEIVAACPQAIPKVAYAAGHINDCFAAFDLLHESQVPTIALCMGPAGVISRIGAPKLGALVTFASIDEAASTAPGQPTIETMRRLYRFESIDSDTQLFGVIADPVGHSMSPAIHNACFADKGMNRLYLPLLVQGGAAGFNSFLDNLLSRPWLGFRGFSVTIPHKAAALEYVRAHAGDVEPLAAKIGAVNTITIDDQGRLAAYNTDYAAILDAITDALGIGRKDLAGMPTAVIGAGGVARALVAGLSDVGARLTIYNRTVSRAAELAGEFGCEHTGLDALVNLDARLIVNCTSVGMHPKVDACPLPEGVLKGDMVVFDTIYNPVKTQLLQRAEQAGATTIDGVTMFVNQAMAQFRLFTGGQGNAELMRRTVLSHLSR